MLEEKIQQEALEVEVLRPSKLSLVLGNDPVDGKESVGWMQPDNMVDLIKLVSEIGQVQIANGRDKSDEVNCQLPTPENS